MSKETARPVCVNLDVQDARFRKRWLRVRSWLASIFSLPENEAAAEAVRDYASTAYDAGLDRLREVSIRNKKTEAEIAKALAEARQSDSKSNEESILLEGKRDLLAAQAAKTRAEAGAIEIKAKLDALEALARLGLDIAPILNDGELKGLFIIRSSVDSRDSKLGHVREA